jgi:uncharacterized protein with ATP-grasp and redox domains
MKTVPACLACILGDVYAAAGQVAKDEAQALRVARDAMAFLSAEFGLERVPSYYITEVHRILKRDTGVAVPFAESRRQLNQIGLEIARRIWAEAERREGPERFRFLATWALAGNSLDSRTVGIGYGFDPERTREHLQGYVDRGLARDDLAALYRRLGERPAILYVHDNVGEIALDALLIRELRRLGCRVTSALRGGPITSDATLEDGRMVGMEREADRVILAGPDTLGISWEEASPELREAIGSAGLIIAKGQANYYVFSEHRHEVPGDVFCLFTIKCQPVADVLGVQPRQAVAIFLR